MRLIVLAAMLLSVVAAAQPRLADSRQSSYSTFVYKLPDARAGQLYEDIYDLTRADLHELVDVFPSDSLYRRHLPPGHYVFVKAVQNDLAAELRPVVLVRHTLLNNHRDLVVQVTDTLGHLVPDASVSLGRRAVPWDAHLHAYRLPHTRRKGLLAIRWRDHTDFAVLEGSDNRRRIVRIGYRVLHTFPINHLLSPFTYLYRNTRQIIRGSRPSAPGFWYRLRRLRQREVKGYMVFNKPTFKPGDSVLMKAFVTSHRGRPLRRPAELWINARWSENVRKVATLRPFRAGAYEFVLPLADSLELDRTYDLTLRRGKRKFQSASFNYEAYTLRNNTYNARSEQPDKHQPPVLYLKAEDSNGMTVYDARAEVLLRPTSVQRYHTAHVFVPDTLWYHEVKLDPNGETAVRIPASALPAADLKYKAVVSFLDASGERVDKELLLNHEVAPAPLRVTLDGDTVRVTATGNTVPNNIRLDLDLDGHEIRRTITVPFATRVEGQVSDYSINWDDGADRRFDVLDLSDEPHLVHVQSQRRQDSLIVASDNPRRLLLRYFLFRNGHLIERGAGESFVLRRAAHASESYSLSVQFVWGSKPETQEYYLDLPRRALHVAVNHEPVIYPGQQANLSVEVKDAAGRPVANADVTSWAVTNRLEGHQLPAAPTYGRKRRGRPIVNEYSVVSLDDSRNLFLDWHYWRHKLGLDSMAYYRFVYPEGGLSEVRVLAAVPTVVPIAVEFGAPLTVHVVYIDGVPVFFREASETAPYAFETTPGIHQVALRLTDKLLTVDSVRINAAEKLMFSIDLYNLPRRAITVPMPYSFTDHEQRELGRYIMMMHRDLDGDFGIVRQGARVHAVTPRTQWIGPLKPGPMHVESRRGVMWDLNFEPNFSYEFTPGLVRQREGGEHNALSFYRYTEDAPRLGDDVLTEAQVRREWAAMDSAAITEFNGYPDSQPKGRQAAKLTITVSSEVKARSRVAFLVDPDRPDEYMLLRTPIEERAFTPGHYHAVLLLDDGRYLRSDSIVVRANGINYYQLHEVHHRDTLTNHIRRLMLKWSRERAYLNQERQREAQSIRALFYLETSAPASFTHTASGHVLDNDGSPLPGINVVVKGTVVGTVTDGEGYYRIKCPPNGVLVFSFIGYMTRAIPALSPTTDRVVLEADVKQLSEVVVVGYGTETILKHAVLSVATQLSGVVAGVNSSGTPGAADSVRILLRGASAISGPAPLVVMDGRIMRFEDIDPAAVKSIEILRGDQSALYGSRGAGGVILVSTTAKLGVAELHKMASLALGSISMEPGGSSLRRNFRDYAYWQPRLRTDASGRATFTTTFPDDITSWTAYALAVGHRRSGQGQSTIRSYKPLLATVSAPQLLVEGDTARAVGKITNYSAATRTLTRTIHTGATSAAATLTLANSHIDTLLLTPAGGDTLDVRYEVDLSGYRDGELRRVPVLRAGVHESAGEFAALRRDTTFTWTFDPAGGPVHLVAHADLLDVILDEATQLVKYPYGCNEQLASRLLGMLAEEAIAKSRGANYRGARATERLAIKLVGQQRADGGWSWWGTGEGSTAVTVHVARALDVATRAGHNAVANKDRLLDFLLAHINDGYEGLLAQEYLLENGVQLRVDELVDSLRRMHPQPALHVRLHAERLAQLSGATPDWTWIYAQHTATVKGNWYWAEPSYNPWYGSVLNSELVYRMIARRGDDEQVLARIRNYFLEQRSRRWHNTVQSARLITTLLPTTLASKAAGNPVLDVSGADSRQITQFPQAMTLSGGVLQFTYRGATPAYVSAWQERWVAQPAAVDKDFKVTTSFSAAHLTAGKPVDLEVQVEVLRDADYVMVEVPIPSGCTYASKPQAGVGETHREYAYDKANIYLKQLKRGHHTFTIPLLARFAGSYTLNPALVECMYFPTLYGRTGMKRVRVE